MRVERLEVGPLGTNCWIVVDDLGGPLLVIDPGGDAPVILEAIGAREVAAVALTHAHFDHVGAAGAVVAATGAPLVVHRADAKRIMSDAPDGTGGALFGFPGHVAPGADRTVVEGDELRFGALHATVRECPGHTQGGIALLVAPEDGPAHIFSGDSLFAGSVGRTDFPGGDARALASTIARVFAPLASDTHVHPGHGPDTTIGRESRVNPFWPRS